jgi:hypothetical protein
VRDDICLREISGGAELLIELAKEGEVEIYLAVDGAVERPDFRAPDAARRLRCAVEQHQDGRHVGLATLAENLAPRLFRIGEHDGNEFCLRIPVAHARGAGRLILRGTG